MSDPGYAERSDDHHIVRAQLGREPRGIWAVAARCAHDRPSVIETASRLDDGTPFPTLYWLSCPWLRQYVDGLESAGAIADWASRVRSDLDLASALLEVDDEYRRRRAASASGADPVPGVGLAGQADPLAVKCLHAHVANDLAGLADPIGHQILAHMGGAWCPDDVCVRHLPEVQA